MPASPPTITSPPVRTPFVRPGEGFATSPASIWMNEMFLRVGGATGRPTIGAVAVFQTAVDQAGLAAAGAVILLAALKGEQWQVREIRLSGAGTSFSGGNRNLSIGDGMAVWTVIPAATLQSLAAARWGDSGVPYPAVAGDLTQPSAAGVSVTAQYSGGTTDYTAGALTLVLTVERVA